MRQPDTGFAGRAAFNGIHHPQPVEQYGDNYQKWVDMGRLKTRDMAHPGDNDTLRRHPMNRPNRPLVHGARHGLNRLREHIAQGLARPVNPELQMHGPMVRKLKEMARRRADRTHPP